MYLDGNVFATASGIFWTGVHGLEYGLDAADGRAA
jgi:hypothetical protein